MKKLVVVPALLKAHVDSFTRKDGTFVQAHDDKRQAAAPKFNGPAVASKHDDIMARKSTEWDHHGYEGKKVPHADVAGAPEFSHKEVYGHDGKTSPAGTDFHPDFAAKEQTHFVLKHPNGKRSFVNTEGAKYARYHAPVEDAPAAGDAKQAGASYDHPTVVGHAQKLAGGDANKAHGFHFAGKKFTASGKTGKSNHDGTPVRHFKEVTAGGEDSGDHVWMDGQGRVHADATSDVKRLRSAHEEHQKQWADSGNIAADAKKVSAAREKQKAAPAASKPATPDEVKQHAMAAGAKFKTNVSVFSKPDLAHSFADQTKGAKGGAFVMKHPDHDHHVVVSGADAQRMEKNGYQHAKPGLQKSFLLVKPDLLK